MAARPALDRSARAPAWFCSRADSRASTRRLFQFSARSSALCAVLALMPCTLLGLGACAGADKPVKVTPITPAQERVFDHGVDFVAALQGLEGRWREDWDRDLHERVGGADFIGVVHIDAILTETDPAQRVTHRLRSRTKRAMWREAKDPQLKVSEGQPGFGTVHDNLQRIEARDFVVYLKWYVDEDGEPSAHFHMSPASEVIVGETERAVAMRERGENITPKERVVVHTNY
jgi:hypothetical protein